MTIQELADQFKTFIKANPYIRGVGLIAEVDEGGFIIIGGNEVKVPEIYVIDITIRKKGEHN